MFFWLSKILWFLVEPLNLLFAGVCLSAVFLLLRWNRAARVIVYIMAVAMLGMAVVPAGENIVQNLENRFPVEPELPHRVHGIIVLGGVISPVLSKARARPQLGGGIERVSAAVDLMRKFPDARVIFTGGSGDPFQQELKEAHFAPQVFAQYGIDPGRIQFEAESRNTVENAQLTYALAKPKAGDVWVLVTSAFHMPRSVGVFRKAGWRVIAYPVDFGTTGTRGFELTFNFRRGLGTTTQALHETLGLLFYWLTDRTDHLFPGPGQ